MSRNEAGKYSQERNESGIVVLPEALVPLSRSVADVDEAFHDAGAPYRLVGSINAVCSTGRLFRNPNDIDGWYDGKDSEAVTERLLATGYQAEQKRTRLGAVEDVFYHPDTGTKIELRQNTFTRDGMHYHKRIPALSARGAELSFFYPAGMMEPVRYRFGEGSFVGLSPEASYINLLLSWAMRGMEREEDTKRQTDLVALENQSDPAKVRAIMADGLGIYLNEKPLLKITSPESLRLFTVATRDAKRVRNLIRPRR